eukprot:CAMPEP_0177579942 /NCGR_PEP_ID=MMETSP0419_2-20121207/1256_1 /TAXON_ID=582737 /ORGANISM="Tetraselmis sp., Strain GSL018" /LENGTH=318 /DNA_ID=CAMNT_0019068697 /DNA_START=272 /DNA_END=1227 /DNA_ORIENTATION=+
MNLSEEDLQALYSWVDEIPLSRPKRNIARDFSDGVLLAEIMYHYFPKLVELHNYSSANAAAQKMYNWNTLNQRVFKRLGFQIHRSDCEEVVNAVPGAIEGGSPSGEKQDISVSANEEKPIQEDTGNGAAVGEVQRAAVHSLQGQPRGSGVPREPRQAAAPPGPEPEPRQLLPGHLLRIRSGARALKGAAAAACAPLRRPPFAPIAAGLKPGLPGRHPRVVFGEWGSGVGCPMSCWLGRDVRFAGQETPVPPSRPGCQRAVGRVGTGSRRGLSSGLLLLPGTETLLEPFGCFPAPWLYFIPPPFKKDSRMKGKEKENQN